MKNNFTATIFGGIYKGKKIILPNSPLTRPTKSLAAHSFFDTLSGEIRGRVFIEMFAGSAFMACAALSFGAKKCVAIEKNAEIFKIAQKNTKSLKNENITAINGDSFAILPNLIAQNESVILYIDPPFETRENFGGIYEKIMKFLENFKSEKIFLIVFEHISTHQMPQNFGDFSLFKVRKFGKTTLSYFCP